VTKLVKMFATGIYFISRNAVHWFRSIKWL